MNYLLNENVMKNNLKNSAGNFDVYVAEYHSVLASILAFLGEESYCELQESKFPFRSAGNALSVINSYIDSLIDLRNNFKDYVWTNDIMKSLTNCADLRKSAIQVFYELEESIKNSNGEERNLLTKIYNRNRFAINQLLGAARDLAKIYNVNIDHFELSDF